MRFVNDKVEWVEGGPVVIGGTHSLMRLVVYSHGGDKSIVLSPFGDDHANAVDGEGHAGLLLVVHRGDGERELAEIVANIIGGVVNGLGRGFGFGFCAGCKEDCKAA